MAKLTLNDITSGYASTTALNDNFNLIETALENTLSRDGTTPNSMQASLDMNGHMILNQANPVTMVGFNWEGDWLTGTTYQVGDVVQEAGAAYICIVEHTAGTFATDLAAAKWQLVVQANFPAQAGNANKFIQTNGTTVSWQVPDSSEVSFTQSGTGAVIRPTQDKLRETVSVTDFGAVGDGVTDDTAAIQAAHTASSKVYYPSGTYLVSAPILITLANTKMWGDGNATKIITSHTTADIYTLGNGVSEFVGYSCRDMALDATVQKSAGWAFNCRLIARAVFENVYITRPEDATATPKLYGGIYFDRFDYCSVLGGNIITNTKGISCRGNSDQSFGAGLFLGDGLKVSTNSVPGSTGVLIGGGAGGIYFGNMDIIACENSVIINTSLQTGTSNREVFFGAECSLDSPGFANIYIAANGLTHLDITGTWIASSGMSNTSGPGILIETPNPNLTVQMTGPRLFNNAGGALIANAGDISWCGGTVYSNGSGGLGHDAISLVNPNVTAFRMTGVKVDNNGVAGVGYGLRIAAGVPSTLLNVQSNSFYGNAQGAISFPNTFTANHIIKQNVGFVTESSGTATVVATQSNVIVNHGIDSSLSARIVLTPVGNSPESGQYWASVPTTTQFTLNLGTTATRNNDFVWRAEAV